MPAEPNPVLTNPPNVLLIITDQFNPRMVGYAGHPIVRTPNIDRLAAEGMVFSRMYTNQPLCMPARATLFTGLTPRGHGVRMNGIPLDTRVPTFTEALRQGGYHTHCSGKIHLNCAKPTAPTVGREFSPELYPEFSQVWKSGMIRNLPSPYYGLESVDFVGGHGDNSWGHYTEWLKAEHPDRAHLYFDKIDLDGSKESPESRVYKWALPAELHPAAWITDRSIAFLEEAAKARANGAGRPFCLMCSIQEPHGPLNPPAPYCYRYDPADMPEPFRREGELDDLPPHFRDMVEKGIFTSGTQGKPTMNARIGAAVKTAYYFGLIEMVDDQVGRLMETLKETGLDRDTLVILLADHGDAMGDHDMWGKGPYHFDSVIRVPFIAWWPGRVEPGSRHGGVVSLQDVAPTILDVAGIPIPEGDAIPVPEAPGAPSPWPGRSLRRVFEEGSENDDDCALVEMDEDYLGTKLRTLVTRRYRLTAYAGREYGELFDLQEDPEECWNLWNDPSKHRLRDDLRFRLLDEIMRTDISVPRQIARA